jgi:PBSX family phage terminase large subunit
MTATKINWKPFSETAIKSMSECDSFINIYEGAVRSGKTVASIIAWLSFIKNSPHKEFLMTGKTSDTLYRNVLGGDLGLINIMSGTAKYSKSSTGGAKLSVRFINNDFVNLIEDLEDEGIIKIHRNSQGEVIYKRAFASVKENKKLILDYLEETDDIEIPPLYDYKTIYCLGANDERAEGNIRGMTIGGWYADEATLYPDNFIKQAINRMSLDGARAFWTMNPDSPYHPIKKEYIDSGRYKVFHFELDDNMSLSERYKNELKKAYSGLWYKRMVLGLWVMADGVVYKQFNQDRHIINDAILARDGIDFVKYYVGCDYGATNPTTFVLIGITRDSKCYVLNEYYHSGREGDNKSPQQYSEAYQKWVDSLVGIHGEKIKPERCYIDPSAKSFMLQLWQDGINNVTAANNSVNEGIELVTNLIGNDMFFVHERCKHVLQEIDSYIWDVKAQKRGIDKPVKEYDHTLDAIRYVIYSNRLIFTRKAG